MNLTELFGVSLQALRRNKLRSGLTLLGVDSIYQVLITGILVIVAVAVDQLTRRRSSA